MTTEQKLQTMEALWDSLWPKPDEVSSPDWHGKVLQERAERVAAGRARFSDWETAKERLAKRSP
jgi:hypothetical protein